MPEFGELIKKTCGIRDVEVIEYVNPGKYSLSEIYNKGLKESKNDIVVFCHNDISFDSKNWGKRIVKRYEKNPDYGILGVAGTKHMSTTGRWWDDFSKMYGNVYHEHEGKKWLSKYSSGINDRIEDVILVDGLFFAVNKNNIKKNFDESVEGFHFYEVTFCFDNFLEGVKIGVIHNIKVVHKSIGMTNDQWEENRKVFAEKYKDKLPVTLNRDLPENYKLKVLIGCLKFNEYTGSELYVYELAKELVKQNCDVTICSQLGSDMVRRAMIRGIKLVNISEPPGFKRGDGEWILQTPDGEKVSEKDKLYKLSEVKYDIMHLNHTPITEYLLKLFPNTPVISTIHSEVLELEKPVIHDNILKYIAIRPEIKQHLIDRHEISENKIEVVYNPIDGARFKPNGVLKHDKKRVLFVGTIDYLRKDTIFDLIGETKREGSELWIVGIKREKYLDDLNEEHIKYFDPTWNVEKYVQQCDETASILLGRTTIEGWL
jgi:glycosyltransferase involved in cell wall biosynthesis